MAREAAVRAARPGGGTGMGLLMGQYLDSRPLPGGHYLAGLAGCPRSNAQEVRGGGGGLGGVLICYLPFSFNH